MNVIISKECAKQIRIIRYLKKRKIVTLKSYTLELVYVLKPWSRLIVLMISPLN